MTKAAEIKATVVVGRKWDNPNIHMFVSADEIGIQMNLADFLHALAAEVGNPTTMVTIAGLERKLKEASVNVVNGMKNETARVM